MGLGTALGSGCTSGHGICGLARLAPRSMAATATFMAAGAAVAALTGACCGALRRLGLVRAAAAGRQRSAMRSMPNAVALSHTLRQGPGLCCWP